MLSLLSRYILRDLLRVMALTAAVLVTVIAFGATIKPLTSDELLSAGQVVKYLVLVMVPMLQFALPFAAGFAGTMVMHRMGSDNEIVAAAASGISYRRMLLPVVCLGVALLIIMVVLTQWVIPKAWGVMQRTVAADAVHLFEASVSRGQPFRADNQQIYAESVIPRPAVDRDADARLMLLGVAAVELDESGQVVRDVVASRAVLDVYRRADGTYLSLVLIDADAYDHSTRQRVRSPELTPDPIVVPAAFVDDPMTMTRNELHALRADPDRAPRIVREKAKLAAILGELDVLRRINEELADTGSIRLPDLSPDPRAVIVHAAGLDDRRLRPGSGGDVIVEQLIGDRIVRRLRTTAARLERGGDSADGVPTGVLVLEDVEVLDLRTNDVGRREQLTMAGLSLAGFEPPDLRSMTADQMIRYAGQIKDAPPRVPAVVGKLERRLTGVEREVSRRLWQRYAISCTAPLVLLLGTVLAMWRRESLPLTIYLWAFMPSILAIILISGGTTMIDDGKRVAGLVVLWSGDVLLVGALAFAYFKLVRN